MFAYHFILLSGCFHTCIFFYRLRSICPKHLFARLVKCENQLTPLKMVVWVSLSLKCGVDAIRFQCCMLIKMIGTTYHVTYCFKFLDGKVIMVIVCKELFKVYLRLLKYTWDYEPLPESSPESVLGVDSSIQVTQCDSVSSWVMDIAWPCFDLCLSWCFCFIYLFLSFCQKGTQILFHE